MANVHIHKARLYRCTESGTIELPRPYLKHLRVVGATASATDTVEVKTEDGDVFWETVADGAGFIDEILWEDYIDGETLEVTIDGALILYLKYA